jgi:cell division protein FtsB
VKEAAPQKKVKMSGKHIDDDHEGDWQQQEIKKLEQTVADLVSENSDLRKKLVQKNYD